jgi:hypothetical protein
MQSLQFVLLMFWLEACFCLGRSHLMYSYPGYPVSTQLWLLQLSILVKPTGLSFSVKKQTPMQESANQISVAIKYLLLLGGGG